MTEQQITENVELAIAELAKTRRAYVQIADLVEYLPHRQADIHKALLSLHRTGRVNLEPEPFGHRVTPRLAEAAIHLGGEDRHLVGFR